MEGGWIKLWRCGEHHPAFRQDGPWRVFTFCLWRAKYKAEDGVPRGSFFITKTALYQAMSYRGKPSASTLWRNLKELERLGSVTLKTLSSKVSLVTVCNYESYQDKADDDETLMKRSWNADETLTPFAPLRKKEGKEGQEGEGRAAEIISAHASPPELPIFPKSELDESEFSAAWLARMWLDQRRGCKGRLERDAARETFEEMIRRGCLGADIATEIMNRQRDRTEPIFRFQDRVMRSRGLGVKNGNVDLTGLQDFAAGPG